jgi:hypothetical protein
MTTSVRGMFQRRFRSFIKIKDISSSECQKEKGTLREFYSFLDGRAMKRG